MQVLFVAITQSLSQAITKISCLQRETQQQCVQSVQSDLIEDPLAQNVLKELVDCMPSDDI